MTTSINVLFILLGMAIGGPVGYGVAKFIVWYHRTKAGIRLAMPMIRMGAYALGALGFLGFLGVMWVIA